MFIMLTLLALLGDIMSFNSKTTQAKKEPQTHIVLVANQVVTQKQPNNNNNNNHNRKYWLPFKVRDHFSYS
jgi:hypothetical protein